MWEGGRLSGWLDYSTDLFEPATIDRLVGHFQVVLEAIVRLADLPVLKLPLLTERERRLMLHDWNDTARKFPCDHCLHELFERNAARAPGRWPSCSEAGG